MRIKNSEFRSKTLKIYFWDILLMIYEMEKIAYFEASKADFPWVIRYLSKIKCFSLEILILTSKILHF